MNSTSLALDYDSWRRPSSRTYQGYQGGSYINQTHTLDHDLHNRVTTIDGPWTDDTINFTYNDAARSVTRASPGGVSETTTCDALGDIASIANALGVFTHQRGGPGELLQAIIHTGTNAGFDTAFTYHDDAQDSTLASITATRSGGDTVSKHSFGYDSLNQLATWKRESQLPNPTGPTRAYEWKSYHDFASQIASVVEKDLSGNPQCGWDYQYDSAGNIASVQKAGAPGDPASLTHRTHNSLNQITGLGGGGVSTIRGTLSEPGSASVGIAGQRDKPARMLAGNRFETEIPLQPGSNSLAITALDDTGNRSDYAFNVNVAPQSPRSFQYDADGNLLADGVRTYEWDVQSRLMNVSWGQGSNKSTAFRYNALGQRSERIEKTGTTETAHYYYLYDGIHLLSRYTNGTAAANIDRQYLQQGEQHKNGGTWEKYHYCRDHLGSVREVVKSDGTLAARYDYDPYGKRLPQYQAAGYTGGCDLGFTGHITQPSPLPGQGELVMTFYRGYDPELGRWLSADPLGEEGGVNLYAYVLGDPINGWDPLGLDVFINRQPGIDGHAWVKVGGSCPNGSSDGNTYGFYPNGDWWGKPGVIESNDRHTDDTHINWTRYKTTPAQEAAFEKWIQSNFDINYNGKASSGKTTNPNYNLGTNDCQSWSGQAEQKLWKILSASKARWINTPGTVTTGELRPSLKP